jgi:N6-adenosine-specific RNA methylase IME4
MKREILFETMAVDAIRTDKAFMLKYVPEPDSDSVQTLAESIREDGVLVPLLVSEDDFLLDGHRRYLAAREAGLEEVPVVYIPAKAGRRPKWAKAVAMTCNLNRRHFTPGQRAFLGDSLLRMEQTDAKERMREGARHGGKAKKGSGKSSPTLNGGDRSTARVAKTVDISRKSFERAQKIKRYDPELGNKLTRGKISIEAAYKQVKTAELREHVEEEQKKAPKPGVIRDLSKGAGKYRCLYADPPWAYRDSGTRGAAAGHYDTMTVEELCALPVGELAHAEGCLLWLWTTWPMIRDGAPQQVLDAWGYEWVGELVWDKEIIGTGRWIRSQSEILILAKRGKLSLLESDQGGVVRSRRTKNHSAKPPEFYGIIERLSAGPRIELFARNARKGWSRWGHQA